MKFTDAGVVPLNIVIGTAETAVFLPVYEIEASLFNIYDEIKKEDDKRKDSGGSPMTLLEVVPIYKELFQPFGVPILSAGGYKHLAAWVHEQTAKIQKKTLYYESVDLPSSTDSGHQTTPG